MHKVLAIFGSSRSDGNTRKALGLVIRDRNVEVIDLLQKNIAPYDYEYRNQGDDFLSIAEKMTEADVIIFATPVYWYAMSSQLKTFFDRFSDLIRIRKDLGRALKGKTCYLVSSGTDEEFPEGYEVPFASTCDYFDMQYGGSLYYRVEKDEVVTEELKKDAKRFARKIFET